MKDTETGTSGSMQAVMLKASPKPRQLSVAILATLLMTGPALAEPMHPCASDALARSGKLLALHTEGDPPGTVSKTVTVLKPVRNPANSKQHFDVLAIRGFVYKAEYRMRFLYAQIPGHCALVGQEILEYTSL